MANYINEESLSSPIITPVLAPLSVESVSVLIAHENPGNVLAVKEILKESGWKAQAGQVTSIQEMNEYLSTKNWDILISFANSTIFSETTIAESIQEFSPLVGFIYIDDNYNPDKALNVTQLGFNQYLLKEENERLLYCISSIIDECSAKKQIINQTLLSDSVETHSELMKHHADTPMLHIADGMIINVNNEFLSLLGYETAEQIEFIPLIDLVNPDSKQSIKSILKKLPSNEKIQDSCITFNTVNNSTLELILSFCYSNFDDEPCTQITITTCSDKETVTDVEKEISSEPVLNNPVVTSDTININEFLAPLNDIGIIYYIAPNDLPCLKIKMGYNSYQNLLRELNNTIRENCPEGFSLLGTNENWLIAGTENNNEENVIKNLLANLNEVVNRSSSEIEGEHFSAGGAKFGVAGITPENALDKAFSVCANLQSINKTGIEIFAPKLDNAEGSEALQQALELGRLSSRYQPIIGLQNQDSHIYQNHLYLKDDSGQEKLAKEFLAELGVEKENIQLDKWLIEKALTQFSECADSNAILALNFTSSAIVDSEFSVWLVNYILSHNINPSSIIANVDTQQINDHDSACKKFLKLLEKDGIKTGITDLERDQIDYIEKIQTNYIQLAESFVLNLTSEEDSSRDKLQEVIAKSKASGVQCVATGINSAADLAQLWQSGVPFVIGNYLQSPLETMDYSFSEIG